MRFTCLALCFLLSVTAFAQQKQIQYPPKDTLIARRKEIMAAINETQQQLDLIKNDKKATLGQLHALQNKLAERQRLIGNINEQLGDIDNTIKSSSKEVGSLKQKLEQLKVRYAQSIRYAYETRSSYDMLAFLFSSSSFNDAMRRMKYLKKFREFRKQQVEQIRITQNQLQHKIGQLNYEKAQKDELLSTQVQQSQELKQDAEKTNNVIQELKGRESQLLKEIEKNREIAKRVDKAINVLIEREIEKAAKEEEKRAAAAAAATKTVATEKTPKTGTTAKATENPPVDRARPKPAEEVQPLLSTPTEVALAADFEKNKGKLYWPVEKGFISDHFGVHPHPVEHQVMINNSGIDIRTTPDATVKAVFEGTVTSVSYIEGNVMVLLKHGDYFTVYNNLSSASVKTGQQVTTNQTIGVVANNDEGEPTVKFGIWKVVKKKTVSLDPELWIGRAH